MIRASEPTRRDDARSSYGARALLTPSRAGLAGIRARIGRAGRLEYDSEMDSDYWLSRWKVGRIGFHEAAVNPRLVEHRKVFDEAVRVLVPLCGKSMDLEWLVVHGYEVVGIELSELAAQAFFSERGFTPERSEQGSFIHYRHGGVTILVGDFFAADSRELGSFDGAYDRAALVALPEELRRRYAQRLQSLLAPKSKILLVTWHFDATTGPPFSVSTEEIERLYAGATIKQLASIDVRDEMAEEVEAGATFAHENVYVIELKG